MTGITEMLTSDAYVAACKLIRPLVPFGWLSGSEATAIRADAIDEPGAISALLTRAQQIDREMKKEAGNK